MSRSLTQRLLSIEDDFVSALLEGGDALSAFESRWETLLRDIDSLSPATIHPDVLGLAHATSVRLATLADTSIELYDSYNGITSQLMNQVESLMAEFSIADDLAGSPSPESDDTSAEGEVVVTSGRHRKRCREDASEVPERVAIKRRRVSPLKSPRTSKRKSHTSLTSFSVTSPLLHDHDVRSSPPQPIPITPPSPTPMASRKRRFSDADVTAVSQPCKRLYAGPRIHAVSDSFLLPRTHNNTMTITSTCSEDVAGRPSLPLAAIEDLPPLDVLSTSVDLQKDLVNIDLHGGFDLYPEGCPYDGTFSLLAPENVNVFIQSLLDASSSFALHDLSVPAFITGLDTPLLSPHIAASPTTPSPASTPSCPSTPLFDIPLFDSGLEHFVAPYLASEVEDKTWFDSFSLDSPAIQVLPCDASQSSYPSALYDAGDPSVASWSLLLEPHCPESPGSYGDFKAPATSLLASLPTLVA